MIGAGLGMLESAKWSFATRRVVQRDVAGMNREFASARPGDLVLARVVSIGQHTRVQLPSGRPSELFLGDLVVVACGARYAPDQFEGAAEINAKGADLLAGGGCIGRARARNSRIKRCTRLLPIGCLLDAGGKPVNLDRYALTPRATRSTIPVVAVFGTAMNSGKTHATAQLTHGLAAAGYRVAALKGTGTGAFGDFNKYLDAGARYVADFTDAGMGTTYLQPIDRVLDGIETLLCEAEEQGCNIAVMEIADGLFQLETAALLANDWMKHRMSGIVFACGDAVAAFGGVQHLQTLGYRPVALTGIVSCSPMATAEAEGATGIDVLTAGQLADPAEASTLVAGLRRADRAA